MVYPDIDALSSSTGNLTYVGNGEFITFCAPHYSGFVVLKYRPVNIFGERGNITYIFIET